GSRSLSQTGTAAGTIGYMAPEQVDGARDVGPPADVFALGAIIFECLTGQTPFGRAGLADLARARAGGAIPRPSKHRSGVPRWLDAALVRALDPAPGARFQDGAAFARALVLPRRRLRLALASVVVVAPLAVTAAIVLGGTG